MRKSLLLLSLLTGLFASAQDPVLTVSPNADNMTKNSSYTNDVTITGENMTYVSHGFNNNNCSSAWAAAPLRCGRKGIPTYNTFTTKDAVSAAIDKVELVLYSVANTIGKDQPTSVSVKFASSSDFSDVDSVVVDLTDYPTTTNTAATFKVTLPNPKANLYYQIGITMNGCSKNGAMSLNTVSFYGQAEAGALAVPVITLADDNMVEITAENGLDIYYTTDGSEPTTASTKYSAPFAISAPTTVKAISYDGLKTSAVVTKKLSPNTVSSIAAFLNLKSSDVTKINTPLTAIYQNGRNLYLTDGTSFILAYNSSDLASVKDQFKTNGDVISFISGTYKSQNGLPEIIPSAVGEKSSGTAVAPEELSIEEIASDMLNKYVVIKNVDIVAGEKANNYVMTDETGTIAVYNTFYNSTYYDAVTVPEGKGFTVTGFVGCYNSTIQITPISITGGEEMQTVETPVISPENGSELNTGDEITISCATDGAVIRYTIDGTEPTASSPVYDGSILFDGTTMTVKAFASKDGMLDSEVATASYTLLVEGAKKATFKFNEPSTLSPAPEIPTKENTQIKLNEKNGNNVFTAGDITLTFGDGTNTSNSPVIIYPTGTLEGKIEGRIYKNNTMTFSSSKAKITKIIFTQQNGSTTWTNFTSDPEATIDGKTFIYTTEPSKVVLTSIGTSRYITVDVEYIADPTAIDGIMTEDDEAPVEYYNLQGVRVNGDNLTNGIYILRQGSKTSKILVR